jgi:hypothetical protein
MEIDPSHNDALKNVCKVKEILKECLVMEEKLLLFVAIENVIDLLDKTEEILTKG